MHSIPQSISVLIIDQEPAILIFTARVLEAEGIRGLMAQSAAEAIQLASLEYVPIDVVLSNPAVIANEGGDLLRKISELRPGVRHVSMAADVDDGMIRTQLLSAEEGLTNAIRHAVAGPLVRTATR